MRRRDFIAGLGGTLFLLPEGAFGELPSIAIIGVLALVPPNDTPDWRGFLAGLGDTGVVEGKNVRFDWRWPEGRLERLPSLAAELVRRPVTVIFSPSGVPTTRAAKAATTSIPLVFVDSGDPVRDGLVASFKGPNGNCTGVALLQTETTLKQIELLNELIANKDPLGILIDPATEMMTSVENLASPLEAKFGRRIVFAYAANAAEFGSALETLVQEHAAGVIVPGGPVFSNHLEELAALAAEKSLPAIYPNVDLSAAGGLMSYGASVPGMFRLAGNYVGKILNGAKPEDLPVSQPTDVLLKVNLRVAKRLHLTVPTSILARADKVIE